jgi:AhpD family alkylhydroperoxidase
MKRLSLALLSISTILCTTTFTRAENETPAGMPWFFQTMPNEAQQSAWALSTILWGVNTAIPPKYKELIGLAVASQIPCQYCIYAHTASAKKAGATSNEIREAIAVGALTRMWSTIVQGNQTDFEKFKATVDGVGGSDPTSGSDAGYGQGSYGADVAAGSTMVRGNRTDGQNVDTAEWPPLH